jgi:surfeit locus 1 family protein
MSDARRSLLWPSLFTLVAFAILMSLGFWQVERLHWKEALIARIEARIHAAPVPLPPASTWAQMKADDYDYQHVRVDGVLDSKREALIFRGVGKVSAKDMAQPGYWVMVPLKTDDGGEILINRGFVPFDRKELATRPDPQRGQRVSLTGLLRAPEERSLFTPADDAAKGQWFTRDPRAIAATLGLANAAPFSLDEDAHSAAPGLPAGGATVFEIPNNHLSYAGTWFGLAATLLVVFAVLVMRKRRS